MFLKIVVIVSIFLQVDVLTQHIIDGPCPEKPILTGFDLNKYLGRWYEISRYTQPFEIGCECGHADYTLNDDGSVRVNNCCKRLPNTTLSCTIGKAVLSEPEVDPLPGKLSVAFRGEPNESNYWILDTDYTNYVIVHFCRQRGEKAAEAFWLLSRTKELNSAVKEKTDRLIDQYFRRSDIHVAEQSDEKCGSDET